MFRFEHQYILYFLALVPFLIIVFVINRKIRQSRLKRFGDPNLISSLHPEVSKYKPYVKLILILLALSFMVFGTANPQIGSKIAEAKREGVDIVIALDISNSMKADDIMPSRLERAKQMIMKLIDNLQSDRIGIVVFAGEAFVQLPLTTDFSAAKLFLSFTEPDLIAEQGTAIGRAIELSIEQFKNDNDNRKRALILISDGENHEDDAVSMASEAADKGFIVHAIAMGTSNGGPIPIFNNGVKTGYLKDYDSNVVITKINIPLMQQIASVGKGNFFLAGTSEPNLTDLIDKLAGMEKKEYESKTFVDFEDRFQYFIAAALFFLIIEILTSETKNKFISGLNLFDNSKRFK